MPRKTKKQKLKADLRRKSQAEQKYPQGRLTSKKPVKTQKLFEAKKKKLNTSKKTINKKSLVTTAQNIKNVKNYAYVKKDLIKITIFTLLALAFQGVLYFLLNRS